MVEFSFDICFHVRTEELHEEAEELVEAANLAEKESNPSDAREYLIEAVDVYFELVCHG